MQSSAFEESLASICGGRGTHYLVLHTDLGSRGHRSCFYLSIQVSDRSRHALACLFLSADHVRTIPATERRHCICNVLYE